MYRNITYLTLKINNDEQDYFHNDADIHDRDWSGKLSSFPFIGLQCLGAVYNRFVFIHCIFYIRTVEA
jgi:hypothetical protein